MSFFEKEHTEENLQYDDVAFLHFILTLFLVLTVILGYVLVQKLKPKIPNYKQLKETGIFESQLENELRRRKKAVYTPCFYFMVLLFLVGVVSVGGISWLISQQETQMIGFDPFEILGVQSNAETREIKKAYRKLALLWHPDRNQDDPQANAKFIMISKAYECLTDEKAIENCNKYGNPDGASSFQVGIGLPKFIISKENKIIILPVVFGILLVILPMIFMKWNSNLKAMDSSGLEVENYPNLHQFFGIQFNATYGFYLLTELRELKNKKGPILSQDEKMKFLRFLDEKRILDMTWVTQRMTDQQLYLLHSLFKHMALRNPDLQLAETIPDLMNSLIKFALIFARRVNDKKFLMNDERMMINWIGTQPIFMLIEFTKTFYNCTLLSPLVMTPFDLLDLQQEDYEVSVRNPLPNGLSPLLLSEVKKNQHLSLFPETHRDYLRRQIDNMALVQMELKLSLGDKEVKEITTEDNATISFRVKKLNKTTGYCTLKKFPFLKEERFYFLFIYENNLIHFEEVTFPNGKEQYVGKFPFKQSFASNFKFHAFLLSDCYTGLDVLMEFEIRVIEPKAEEADTDIEFHEEDLYIERQPKSFFERMLSLEVETPSDVELSDGEEDEEEKDEDQDKKEKHKKNKVSKASAAPAAPTEEKKVRRTMQREESPEEKDDNNSKKEN